MDSSPLWNIKKWASGHPCKGGCWRRIAWQQLNKVSFREKKTLTRCQGYRGMTVISCPGSSKSLWWGFVPGIIGEAGTLTNLPLWLRRPNHRACYSKMPPSQSYKRRCVACQHSPVDQTVRLQAGAREDDLIHLPSGPDCVAWEHQEEEEERRSKGNKLQFSIRSINWNCSLACVSFHLLKIWQCNQYTSAVISGHMII